MPEKKVNLNFFQLVPQTIIPESLKEQTDAIKNVFENLPEIFQPVIRIDSSVKLYGKIEKKQGLFLGTLINTQKNDIPPSFDEDQDIVQALPLTQKQGLGYPTNFLYDPSLRIVMIESIRNGISIATFCRFLMLNFEIPAIEPGIVINPIEMDKFYEMSSYTKFIVKIARLENGSVFQKGKRAISQITNSANNTNTDTLEYALSVRKRHDSLSLSKIRNFITEFLKFKETDEIQILKVSGREEDDAAADTIDFIKQRLKDDFYVEKHRLNSSFDIDEHYIKLLEVYNKHKQALQVYKLSKVS